MRLSPAAVDHLKRTYGNVSNGLNVLIRIDRQMKPGQRAALIRRYGTVSRGLREVLEAAVGTCEDQ